MAMTVIKMHNSNWLLRIPKASKELICLGIPYSSSCRHENNFAKGESPAVAGNQIIGL